MPERTTQKRKYKIVFRQGKPLTKLALLGVIVLSSVALIALSGAITRAQNRLEDERNAAIHEELLHDQWQDKQNNLGSVDAYKEIAGSELGMEDPDVIIFVPKK